MVAHLINLKNEFLIIIREDIANKEYFDFITDLEKFYLDCNSLDSSKEFDISELNTFLSKIFENFEIFSSDDIHAVFPSFT